MKAETDLPRIKTPVRYDGTNADSQIFDADDNLICDVRGWGRLVSESSVEEAATLQDAIGEQIADALNNAAQLEAEVKRLVGERDKMLAMFNSVGVIDIGTRRFIRNNVRFGNNKWSETTAGAGINEYDTLLEAYEALSPTAETQED